MQSRDNQRLQHITRKSANKKELHTAQRITHDKNNNSFGLLYNEPECYVCHNFGHKDLNCHLKDCKIDSSLNYSAKSNKVWKKKEDNKCGLVLSIQKLKGPWYIDNGCSKHMSGDKSKFPSLSQNK